jgi:hypothetical protein
MVRDVFHSSGFLLLDACGQVVQIVLNQAAPLASALVDPLRKLLLCAQVAVNSSERRQRKRQKCPPKVK